MDDLEIFELSEGFSADDLKKAFRKKSKLFHPDRNRDNLQNHLAMIRLNQAYANLQKINREKTASGEGDSIDRSYVFYKEGIDKFQSIHPSQWKSLHKEGLFNAGAIETDPHAADVIRELILTMAEAYHLFSELINEFPQSDWYSDSFNKMKEIEKMTQRYAKILQSYS